MKALLLATWEARGRSPNTTPPEGGEQVDGADEVAQRHAASEHERQGQVEQDVGSALLQRELFGKMEKRLEHMHCVWP